MTGRTVWLASYPKSGNTWFRTVFAAWRTEDPFALQATDPIASLRAQLDPALGLETSDLTAEETDRLRPQVDEAVDALADAPHLRKIHDALFTADGASIVSTRATRCAVYLIRDPRDVAVSFAHHTDQTVVQATQRLCSPVAGINTGTDDIAAQARQHLGTWSEHVLGWVDRAPFPVHVLRYEDCLADPVAAFGAALGFAGFDIGEDELRDAVAHASFTSLQERERTLGFAERLGRSPFFRRGTAGGWRDELDPDLAARIETTHAEVMRRFGYLDAPAGSTDVTVSSNASSDASA